MPGHSLVELVDIMRRLLAPDGCPWDREQTVDSLKPYLVEETYEVLEAIETGDASDHCEELGDLLLQVVFQAALRQAEGAFAIDDVIAAITTKLIRRHPHVFGDASADTAGQVKTQWDQIKDAEKQAKNSAVGPRRTLEGIPANMPALARAQKLGARAADVGFDWPDVAGCVAKIKEEIGELEAALARAPGRDSQQAAAISHELGDLLFATVNLARKLGRDAESTLREANRRFASRFAHVEQTLHERGRSLDKASLEEMDALWNEAKKIGVTPGQH